MCFSAGASFGAGIVLTVIGTISIKKAGSSSQLFLAGVPLIFAVQQVSEGFLWLALSNPAYAFLQQFTTYAFLFFAQVVWPLWIPLSMMMAEENKKRRKILTILVGVGVFVIIERAYGLLNYPVDAKIA